MDGLNPVYGWAAGEADGAVGTYGALGARDFRAGPGALVRERHDAPVPAGTATTDRRAGWRQACRCSVSPS